MTPDRQAAAAAAADRCRAASTIHRITPISTSAGRFQDIADGSGADVIIGNHTEYNDALARLERTKARRPGEPNPWVVGKGEVRNYLTVVQECAKSWLAIGEGRP